MLCNAQASQQRLRLHVLIIIRVRGGRHTICPPAASGHLSPLVLRAQPTDTESATPLGTAPSMGTLHTESF